MKTKLLFALSLMVSISGFSQTTRLSLMEEFTGETCGPCAATNPGLNNTLAANASKVIAIKWQVPIPSAPTNTWSLYQTNKTDITARSNYYAINFAPQARMDGQHLTTFSSGASDHAGNVTTTLIATAQAIPSPFSITMVRAWNPTCGAVNVTITVQASMNYTTTSNKLKFHTVMVERLIQFSVQPGTNGETTFSDVAIKSFPTVNGYTLNNAWTAGQTQTFTLSCAIPSYTRKKSEVALVGFIQDDANQQVLQAERADKVPVPTTSLTAIDVKVDVTCSSAITPQLNIYNNGANAITQFTITPYIDQVAGNTTVWTGNLAVGASTMITLNNVTTPLVNGPHTFSYQITMSNPYDLTNISSSVKYLVATNYQNTPIAESFSVPLFPPANWTIVNPNNGPTWSRVTNIGSYASSSQIGCVKFAFFNDPVIGDVDELYLPPVDLSGTSNPILSFDIAKAQRNAENDQLDILVSTDCGLTWTNVFSKAGQVLATTNAVSTSYNAFLAQDWQSDTIALNGFAVANVLIKFKATNDNGNNLYLDNINLGQRTPVGIKEIRKDNDFVSFFPNPADKEVTLGITSNNTGNSTIKITNSIGQLVYTHQVKLDKGLNNYKIDTQDFAAGVYFVTISSLNETITKRMVVSR